MQTTQTEQTDQAVPPEFENLVTDLVDVLVNEGLTVGQVHGFTEEEYEAIYNLGFNQYNQGKFEEAARYFRFLTFYNHLEPRYAKAMGACLQMLERYPDAVSAYTMAIVMDAMDPEPMLRVAECLIAMGEVADAAETLDGVIKVCDEAGGHDAIKARAIALASILSESGITPGGTAEGAAQ